ncbi:MAG: dihydroneopterin aldolase [Deltaproteobacteria bacterium]|nr:dihydroneopterin aldolase [Deltaproteobacteria bacterium]
MAVDRILIKGLLARCIIGVNESERREKQDVLIDIDLFTDLRKAGLSDRFEDTVDYRCIKKKVLSMVEASQYFLVEALAEAVAAICLENPAVKEVRVKVEKPLALRFANSVGVEINRARGI